MIQPESRFAGVATSSALQRSLREEAGDRSLAILIKTASRRPPADWDVVCDHLLSAELADDDRQTVQVEFARGLCGIGPFFCYAPGNPASEHMFGAIREALRFLQGRLVMHETTHAARQAEKREEPHRRCIVGVSTCATCLIRACVLGNQLDQFIEVIQGLAGSRPKSLNAEFIQWEIGELDREWQQIRSKGVYFGPVDDDPPAWIEPSALTELLGVLGA